MRLQSRDSEEILVQKAINRDRDAFAILYDLHVDRIYRQVYYLLPDKGDAEDITQDAFIKAWNAIDRYKKTGVPFVAWLSAIARNLVIDHFRSRKRLVPLEAKHDKSTREGDPIVTTQTSLDHAYLKDAIRQLKGLKQKVVLMRFIDDMSYEEIARVCNKSEGAIRVIQFRALKDLKRIIMDQSQIT